MINTSVSIIIAGPVLEIVHNPKKKISPPLTEFKWYREAKVCSARLVRGYLREAESG